LFAKFHNLLETAKVFLINLLDIGKGDGPCKNMFIEILSHMAGYELPIKEGLAHDTAQRSVIDQMHLIAKP
jgi:hypothetical protein